MYLMNKVRKLPDKTLYEIIDYSINNPLLMRICTVERDGLKKYLNSDAKDFREEGGFLLSSAEVISGTLFDQGELDIKIEKNLFSLLMELVKKDAFFIPMSVYEHGKDYVGDEISHFSNIRVSSSSMYTGFSIKHNGGWASTKILFVEGGKLQQKSFFIAMPLPNQIETCELPEVGVSDINGRACRIYAYDGEMPIVGEFTPAVYLPLPVVNYLHLQYCRCLNAARFFSDIFEQKGITSASIDYNAPEPAEAIVLKASVKNTPRQRRKELSKSFMEFGGNKDKFFAMHNLTLLERYAFVLLGGVQALKTTDEFFELMKFVKVNRSLYALALMMLRCRVFASPEFFFPTGFYEVVARGGGGGDAFVSIIGKNNM